MALSSQRQRFTIFVSPRNEDFLFYEKVDKQRVQEGIPEYGDPHPDYRKYPNHFFAQAMQADEEGQVYYYYYAAKRSSQDEYNWEHTTVDYKSIQYDLVERTYVTLRAEYDEDSPALASAMPITDGDPFEETDGYVLTARQQLRIGDAGRRSTKIGDKELDSMFVLEKRFFIKRVPLTTTQYDKETGAHLFRTTILVHRDEIPEGASSTIGDLMSSPDDPYWVVDETTGSFKQVEQVSAEWFFVTTNVNGDANTRRVFVYVTPNQNDFVFYEVVDRLNEQAEPTPLPSYGDAHAEFPDHKFVAAVPDDKTGDFYRYYYAADRFKQDEYNFAESFIDIGGVRVSLVRRSYVNLRSAYDPDSPTVGDPMPPEPTGKFSGDYLLVDRILRPIDDETLNSLYVSEERIYAKAPDVSGQEGNLTLQEGGLTLTRTWVVPRDEVGAFTKPAVGDPDSEYSAYKYATRRISQDTPAEIDSYFSVVLDIYARKEWSFRENHQYEIGYKIIERTTLEDDKSGTGNYSVAFDEKGWQRTQRDYELTGFEYPSKVETRPYGKITTTTSAGTEPITSANNTRSRIVFDDGTTQIYQRDVDSFEIDEGSAGQEKEERSFVSITTSKFYRASGDVTTETGSSRVIYDDGVTQVYEVREESATAKTGDAGYAKEERPFVSINTTSTYSTSPNITAPTGQSRIVYRGGGIVVYQVDNETATAKTGDAGVTKEERVFVTVTTTSRYSTSPTVNSETGRSRVVFNNGDVIVYQVDEEEADAKEDISATEISSRQWGHILTTITYTTSPDTDINGSSRPVYRGGGIVVYEEREDEAIPNDTPYVSASDEDIYRKREVTTNYQDFPAPAEINTSSTAVYSDKEKTIYRVDVIAYTPNAQITYNSSVNYSFPPVLGSLSAQQWDRRDGTSAFGYAPVYSKRSYSGPCAAVITETWSETPPASATTIGPQMQPTPIVYSTPLFSVNIGSCLHGEVTFTGTTGNNDPEWEYLVWDEVFPTTVPADWPEEVVVSDEVRQGSDGYIRRTVTVTPPS